MKKGLAISLCVSLCAAAGALSYYAITKSYDKSGKYFGMADDYYNSKPFQYGGQETKQKKVTINSEINKKDIDSNIYNKVEKKVLKKDKNKRIVKGKAPYSGSDNVKIVESIKENEPKNKSEHNYGKNDIKNEEHKIPVPHQKETNVNIEDKVEKQINSLSNYSGGDEYNNSIAYLEGLFGKGNVHGASDAIICRDKDYNMYYGYLVDQNKDNDIVKHFYLIDADGKRYVDKKDVYAFADGDLVDIILENHDLSVAFWNENKYLELPNGNV